MEKTLPIGVLALQGAFAKHCEMLQKLGVDALEVRTVEDLENSSALILPGGESTAISYLIHKNNLEIALKNYKKPLYGTCAGLILMSKNVSGNAISPLGLMDVAVERNAYGRQIHSFTKRLTGVWQQKPFTFEAFFIRAPKVIQVLSSDVEILAQENDSPVLIKQGNRLASTFHPELTQDTTIHKLFVDFIKNYESQLKQPGSMEQGVLFAKPLPLPF